MKEKKYAYGKDTIGDCTCPAVEAGFMPSSGDKTTASAEWYDNVVKELGYSNAQSTIPEEHAKKAWLTTIEQLESKYHKDTEVVRAAKEVAKQLGWLSANTK